MTNNTVVEMRNIVKTFPGVIALNGADFICRAGEVHALMGQNGAGKSTIMKVLAGVYQPDSGEIRLNGEPVTVTSPHHAQQLGISIIYQELNLLPDMNVAENVFLGREPRNKLGFVDARKLEAQASEVLHRLGVDISPRTKVGRLSVAQQQMIEIAKALSVNAQVVIMDEPSATLGGQDLEHVFEVISALKQQGVAVIYISHRLAEIYQVADWVTIFKDGEVIADRSIKELDRAELVQMMIGRKFSEAFPPRGSTVGEPMLTVKNLHCQNVLHDINLAVHSGEVVGISGLIGAGRSELAQAIFGARKIDRGQIEINGEPVSINGPRDAMRYSIGYLPESRKEEGFVTGQSVRHNSALPSLDQRQQFKFIKNGAEKQAVVENVKNLNVKTPGINQEVQFLSGGNQQKVVLAKWLITGSNLLIFDEPTRGIDVGAKGEIWNLMRELANQGRAILMISSELPEVIGMSDRIAVMHKGRIAGILPGGEATEEQVMTLATYGAEGEDHDN
jgi:ribose transport system ATP-binding protein